MRPALPIRGRFILLGLSALLATAAPTTVDALPNIQEVSAALIFPVVLSASTAEGPAVETLLTITNAGSQGINVRIALVRQSGCSACLYEYEASGNGTDVFVVSREVGSGLTTVSRLDGTDPVTCPAGDGFAVVSTFDDDGATLGDNVLLGQELVAHYYEGWTLSVPVISPTSSGSDGDDVLEFDGNEFERLPSRLMGQFLAPNSGSDLDTRLFLFTPERMHGPPPSTTCTVTGADPSGTQFSTTLSFGCWTDVRLEDLNPEFAYPNLGPPGSGYEHGSFRIECSVNGASGGVHGVLGQIGTAGAVLRREDGGPEIADPTYWATLLYQQGEGDPVTHTPVTPAVPAVTVWSLAALAALLGLGLVARTVYRRRGTAAS